MSSTPACASRCGDRQVPAATPRAGSSSARWCSTREATRFASGATPVQLTPREFELLRVLLGEQGRVVTKGKLLRAVWGQAYQGEDSYVYVHVSQLRHKLAAADSDRLVAGSHRHRAWRRLSRAGAGAKP